MAPAHGHVLPTKHPVEPSRVFEEDLRFSSKPLGIGGSGHVYKAKSRSGKVYAVKLFKPYTEDDISWMRNMFSRKGIDVSDSLIDSCFNPWYRESRVYEHIDRYVQNASRPLFLEYYGTTTIPYLACPRQWHWAVPDHGAVSAIVLELHKKSRPCPTSPLTLDEATLEAVKDVYSELKDLEYVHIYIHLREIVDILHQLKIIHRDIRLENVMDGLVLLDFSISWVDIGDFPCVDVLWMRKPRSFEDRSSGELYAIRCLVSEDYAKNQVLRGKLQKFADCSRCEKLMEQVVLACD